MYVKVAGTVELNLGQYILKLLFIYWRKKKVTGCLSSVHKGKGATRKKSKLYTGSIFEVLKFERCVVYRAEYYQIEKEKNKAFKLL